MESDNTNNETKNKLNGKIVKKGSFKNRLKQLPLRRVLIILGVIITLVLIGGVLWSVLNKNSTKQVSNRFEGMSLTDIYHLALETSDNGDYQQAQDILDEALEKDNTQETKTFILSAKTGMALNQEKYQEAYDWAVELAEIETGFNTYQLLAKASLGLGDKDQALEYFRAALETIEGDDEFATYDREWLQSEINNLEGAE